MNLSLHLRPASQKLLFWAFNIGTAMLLLALIWPVLDLISERNGQITAKRDTLRRLQAIVAREAELNAASDQPSNRIDQGEFLSGPNESVIGADLQTRLKTIAARSGTLVRTIQGQPARTAEPLRYIGAQLILTGHLQHLQSTIYEIENSKPFLFITAASLKINAQQIRSAAAEEPTLEARLDVFGALPTTGAGQ
ncbi:type II secretion system protein GspM [Bradyrhizobium sp. WD16]|uniref:type II secretion system protein GspM n=1 Tax=Bradyrhizobium sp. WD16 TaxID=1521768 RepID=UPI0020A274EE|nr:type II secretion system protein GspM [Bradyrhizobium sp. WD16]UTD29048.1 hypothetical protein DB459_21255 [Bradyrhizobium sp. WD16]